MAELSDEVVEFLSASTRSAMLGYLAAGGRPLVAPVWFIVDNGELVFNTGRESAQGRALVRDSRVVICVDDPHPTNRSCRCRA
jgi:nitroimidazol reductase NimA-like FMN-containing flavoprotein (pyridoxamine 5'-phosphate oxidase superfamily)